MSLLLFFKSKTINATMNAPLGASTSTISASVIHSATLSADLGGLVGSGSATVIHSATLSADLGGLISSASTTVSHSATLSADLNGLISSAITAVAQDAALSADLGGMVASASATVIPPAPPAPPEEPSSGTNWYQPRRRPVKKVELPEQIVVEIPQPRRPVLVSARAGVRLGGLDVVALGSVTFSILDDDAEVLLLV